MFCPACGKNISDKARFCKYCGADIAALTEAAQPPRQSVNEMPAPPPDQQRKPEKKPAPRWRNAMLPVLIVVGVAVLAYGVIKFVDNADESESAAAASDSGAPPSQEADTHLLEDSTLANLHAQSALYLWLNGGVDAGSQLSLEDISPYVAENLGGLFMSNGIQNRYPDLQMPADEFDALLREACGSDYSTLAAELEALGFVTTDDEYISWANVPIYEGMDATTQAIYENGTVTVSLEMELDGDVMAWEIVGEAREDNTFAPYELTSITLVSDNAA